MRRVKATDPRNGRPSWRQLGALSGVSTTTITNLVYGKSSPKVETIQQLAVALRVPASRVAGWLGVARVGESYAVPAEVHLLSARQQKALTELIRAMAEEKGGGSGGDTAPMRTIEAVPDLAARNNPRGRRGD